MRANLPCFIILCFVMIVQSSGADRTLDPFMAIETAKILIQENTPPIEAKSFTQHPEIYGIERDLFLTVKRGATGSILQSSIENGIWSFSVSSSASGSATLQYDGQDKTTELQENGLQGKDLTNNNKNDCFRCFIRTDSNAIYTFLIYEIGGKVSQGDIRISESAVLYDNFVEYFLPFSEFIGDADFHNVGAIEIIITGFGDVNTQMKEIEFTRASAYYKFEKMMMADNDSDDSTGDFTDIFSCGGPIDFLSVLLGFFIGIVFVLTAICCGVSIAFTVNYHIVRKLREDYAPAYDVSEKETFIGNQLDQIHPSDVSSSFSLSNIEDMAADSFQLKWESISDVREEDFTVSSIGEFQSLLAQSYIFCLASGEVNGQMKYYLYARDNSDKRIFLMEVVINESTKTAQLALKTIDCSERDIADFINYFFNAISSIIVHPV